MNDRRPAARPSRLTGAALSLVALAASAPAYLLARRWLSPEGSGTVALVAYFVVLVLGGRVAARRARRGAG